MNVPTESFNHNQDYSQDQQSNSLQKSLDIVIFAGGESKRMNSSINKVLLKIAHKAMIDYVLDTATKLQPNSITVVTCAANNDYIVENLNKRQTANKKISFQSVLQENPQGTGNAAQTAYNYIKNQKNNQNYNHNYNQNAQAQNNQNQNDSSQTNILFLYGDTPLVQPQTLQNAMQTINQRNTDVMVFGIHSGADSQNHETYSDSQYKPHYEPSKHVPKYASYGRIFFKNHHHISELYASQNHSSQASHYNESETHSHQTNIIREISKIVEARDLTHQDNHNQNNHGYNDKKEGKDYLYNSGMMYLSNNALHLLNKLPKHTIQSDNECKEEYYLTDIVHLSNAYNEYNKHNERNEHSPATSYTPNPSNSTQSRSNHLQNRLQPNLKCECILINSEESIGVNSKEELAIADSIVQTRLRKKHMKNGAILLHGESTYFSHDTQIGKDAIIHPNVFFQENVVIHDNAKILPCSFLSNCIVYENATIGPFATLRNNTQIKENSHVGNFVEVKNSTLESSTKAKHLSYIGDASLGSNSNIGAGVIFCNFDGVNKNESNIGENVFIGSNSSIISPISIGNDSIIAAGSVISQNLPPNTLSITRSEQKSIKNGASRYKNLKKKKK